MKSFDLFYQMMIYELRLRGHGFGSGRADGGGPQAFPFSSSLVVHSAYLHNLLYYEDDDDDDAFCSCC